MSYFKRISVNDADRILLDHPDTLLLDIRDQTDFNQVHHPKALLLTDPLLKAIIRSKNKKVPVIIYCYHGNSSQDIARMFADFGFKECYSVDGGYAAWQYQVNKKFPISDKLANWMEANGLQKNSINDRIDSENKTAIMLAAKSGRSDIVSDLVEAGANPNLTDGTGNNALVYACLGQSVACVLLLIKADVEVDNENLHGFTALNYSVGLDDIFLILANYFYDDSLLRLANRVPRNKAIPVELNFLPSDQQYLNLTY